jgi:hypothetical protein
VESAYVIPVLTQSQATIRLRVVVRQTKQDNQHLLMHAPARMAITQYDQLPFYHPRRRSRQ